MPPFGCAPRLTLAALHDEFLGAKAELAFRLNFHQRIEGSVKSTVAAIQGARDRSTSSISLPARYPTRAWVSP